MPWVCGNDSATAPVPDPPHSTTVTVSPTTVVLIAFGETVRLTAVAPADGTEVWGYPFWWTVDSDVLLFL